MFFNIRVLYIVIALLPLSCSIAEAKSVYQRILDIEVVSKNDLKPPYHSKRLDNLIGNILSEKLINPKNTYNPDDENNVLITIEPDSGGGFASYSGVSDEAKNVESKPSSKNVVVDAPVPKKSHEGYNGPELDSLIDSIESINEVKKRVIIIDAGHGGKDSGTVGHGRVKEKDIVLLYAKELAQKLKQKKKYQVYLTRDRDIFLSLRMRNRIARKFNADLFISVHADAAPNKKARGLSIYTLSEKASNKEAALLAKKENKADVIAGVDLRDMEKDVSDTLIDLSMREAKNKSRIFAGILNKRLKTKVRVRENALHSAGFVVLKNSNMASVLLEIGFLSNKYDTRNLRKKSYRRDLISGVIASIDEYFLHSY